MNTAAQDSLARLYRAEIGQLTASITRLTGDLQLAEDVIQDAFIKASHQWANGDIPGHAPAWLMTTARNGALDQLRRSKSWSDRLPDVALMEEFQRPKPTAPDLDTKAELDDDLLRLIFTCCHPAIHIDSRVALCLNTVCGMQTKEIASAFIVSDATMSQRLWRAKTKIRDAGIAYRVPDPDELTERLDSVLSVLYLIFNEGWLASQGEEGLRLDLTVEAIRLTRLLLSLMQDHSQVQALLGLMLIQHSRRHARFDADGALVLLSQQDRSLWDQNNIREGMRLVYNLFKANNGNTRYGIMAAIACVHANARHASATDWGEIAALYEHLMELDPSAVVALNYAVAVGERDGPAAGLHQVMQLEESTTMQRYYLYHSTKAEFLRRLGRRDDAAQAYLDALSFVNNQVEKQFLTQQLKRVQSP